MKYWNVSSILDLSIGRVGRGLKAADFRKLLFWQGTCGGGNKVAYPHKKYKSAIGGDSVSVYDRAPAPFIPMSQHRINRAEIDILVRIVHRVRQHRRNKYNSNIAGIYTYETLPQLWDMRTRSQVPRRLSALHLFSAYEKIKPTPLLQAPTREEPTGPKSRAYRVRNLSQATHKKKLF
ncbi:hypothetical protein EVAR_39650_1 [Eumeta japonica]|uniref:Uncharacterized protein n=1 Tax=Eumeta variegata TaxID=151549 RepID=A0A4C1WFZ4_EUMVA|nr:hypothetical protein EVAR_39650_1 [Eumeta japonica]